MSSSDLSFQRLMGGSLVDNHGKGDSLVQTLQDSVDFSSLLGSCLMFTKMRSRDREGWVKEESYVRNQIILK